ncbi:unnamed protein product [Boreogadus saida]
MKQGEVAASWYTGRCEGLQVVQGRGEPDECWLAAWRKGGQVVQDTGRSVSYELMSFSRSLQSHRDRTGTRSR